MPATGAVQHGFRALPHCTIGFDEVDALRKPLRTELGKAGRDVGALERNAFQIPTAGTSPAARPAKTKLALAVKHQYRCCCCARRGRGVVSHVYCSGFLQ